MNTITFHITFYDLIFLVIISIGLTFALLLWFTPKINRPANRFLALALGAAILYLTRIFCIDIRLETWLPHWGWLPLQFSLALGPLIYFYVLKITWQEYKFRWKNLLHFSPLLLQLGAQALAIRDSIKSGATTYQTPAFQQLNPVLQLLAFASVIIYLYLSHRLILRFYRRIKFNGGDRYRHELRWLHNLLIGFGVLWLMWIPFTAAGYFYYHDRLGTQVYYPLYLLLAVIAIWMAAVAYLRPEVNVLTEQPLFFKKSAPAELRQKGIWLKKEVKEKRHYQDPELSLTLLAEMLGLTSHELSRIINTAFKKNFNDFINEYRVVEVVRKMQDPAYDHITLLGIAYESGFNAQSTFSRIFKQMTGKKPLEYKNDLKKDFSSYNLRSYPRFARVILHHETTPKWYDGKLNWKYMFKIYFKTAWRHIKRHKTYSAINVMGLALGIFGCLVIYLIASYEFSFDSFHPDKDRIYCIDINMTHGFGHWNSVPAPMPDAMRSEMSGLEKVAAFQHYHPKVKIKEGDKVIKAFDETHGIIVEAEYFDILPYTWLSGSKKTALNKPMTVVLTQSRAKTYFGDLRPNEMIGKTITYNDSLTVTVTGILQDWNKNSDFDFSDFISYSTIQSSFLKHQFQLDNWYNLDTDSQELVKLPANVSPAQINAQFPSFVKRHLDPQLHLHVQLQPFTSIHFHREYGGPGMKADLFVLYILSAVAIFILLIAAINFINLSTAQSIQRTKEIGIKKVLGSGRSSILFQFLTETFILTLLAVVIAVIAVQPLLNLFAAYIPPGVKFDYTEYTTWIFLAGTAIFTTLLAGFYPARLLSVFRAVSSLKGEINEKTGNKGYLRKSLIVFQFTISLIFIIGTIVIGKQVSYMQNQDLGFKPNNIITLRTLRGDHTREMKVLAEKLRQLPGVEQAITEAFPPMGFRHSTNQLQLQGGKQPIEVSEHAGNEYYVPFYGMKIIAGRNLLPSDSVREYLINQTAARALGFKRPQQAIGKFLIFGGGKKAYPIAGVLADFYENSFHDQIMPVVIENDPDFQMEIALKLTPAEYRKGDMSKLVKGLAKEWKKIYPEEPFDYAFLGDSIAHMYDSDQQTQWLMRTATLITIFISCMGLFGLAMFTTERRTKEISIRKVLGASVTNILTVLNKEVVMLIAISLLILSPIAWIFIHKWLQNFAYHTNLSLWVFILAGAGAMLIALATISFRTIRSATANPVKGLRNE